MSNFGQALRRFRERAPAALSPRGGPRLTHLSQNELGRRAGLDTAYICRLENGRQSTPSHAAVEALADGLGLSDLDRAALLRAAGYLPMRRTA